MDMQPELQWFMRPYLIDFLIEVHQQFRLRPEVLYLAMNIVDRYVSKRVVYKKHYQLVGCAALWIAAKFEDAKDKVPLVKELAEMCCKAYDESAFIQMEGHVLTTITWTVGAPTAEAWLRILCQTSGTEEPRVQNVARFLMELTLFHREFVGHPASHVAQAALVLARFICGKPKRFQLRADDIVTRIAFAIDRQLGEKLDRVSDILVRKYAPAYYGRASSIVKEWYLLGHRFQWVDAPITPIAPSLSSAALQPSSSWSTHRGSWISASPSAGSLSCSSSDAGDDNGPITPITPLNSHGVNPFNMSNQENVAPASARSISGRPASTDGLATDTDVFYSHHRNPGPDESRFYVEPNDTEAQIYAKQRWHDVHPHARPALHPVDSQPSAQRRTSQ